MSNEEMLLLEITTCQKETKLYWSSYITKQENQSLAV